MDVAAEEVLAFWIDEVGPAGWYAVDADLDARVRDRYLPAWEHARAGGHDVWTIAPRSCLALAILLDQFPRNMFRADARAFASDAKARAVAKGAIARGFDRRSDLPGREFFYLPLRHSEALADQERGVRLSLLTFGQGEDLKHSRAHRAVIRRFGRFPSRNAALGRVTTLAEAAWLAEGGYAAALAEVG